MPQPSSPAGAKEARLFRNNRSQAVRIPVEFELPGEKVLIHREGNRLVIEPVPSRKLLDILRGLKPLGAEDAFPDDIDTGLLPLKDVEL
ncbi:antitoxin [Sphingopyxis panaciterrulae]|uniref:Antitoxin VapB n=1 Tax=Sphingopyxis panaciterrulae TaxID=462372 RepID=A0A7W9B7B0_9SPHN|nr:AbrB/MazE/SpoVT family DNA-binding domain-containing protein [Sphingopyxis panaciterrulae]MBB5707332.1 antitoxin VapB [Sphingopyxis panaciterrulae]